MLRIAYQIGTLIVSTALLVSYILLQGASHLGQQLSILLLAVLLIALRPAWRNPKLLQSPLRQASLLFIVATFVQLLILSTGGLESPFLLLAHLTILGMSFAYSTKTSSAFLVLFLATYAFQYLTQSDINTIINDDPATFVLYILSLIIMAPLSQLLANRYHLKDQLVHAFAKQAKVASTIIDSIDQLVVVADVKFNILSTNASAEQFLNQPAGMLVHKPFFSVFYLKNESGVLLDGSSIQRNGQSHQINNLTLYIKNSVKTRPVAVHITPLLDIEGNIEQYGIVISDAHNTASSDPLQAVLSAKQSAMLESLRLKLVGQQLITLAAYIEIAKKIERDRNILHQFTKDVVVSSSRTDVAQLSDQIVAQQQTYARTLGVDLKFRIPYFEQTDITKNIVGELQIAPMSMSGAYFTVITDPAWLSLLLEIGTDVSLLLTLASEQNRAFVILDRTPEGIVTINWQIRLPLFRQEEIDQIFAMDFGSFPLKAKMQIASAMEGYALQSIANVLSFNLSVSQDKDTGITNITCILPKAV